MSTYLFIPSFLCLVELLWNAHFVSSTMLVSPLPPATFLVLLTKLGCSGVSWLRVIIKLDEKNFHERYDIRCKKIFSAYSVTDNKEWKLLNNAWAYLSF